MTFTSLGRAPAQYAAYPPWPSALVTVVEKAIQEAWRTLLRDHVDVLATRDEDIISSNLVDILIEIRAKGAVPGFTADLFGMPTRDSKQPDWTGKKIDQTPDITIYTARPRPNIAHERHDALFFECKVLHENRRLKDYGDEGMERFVDGRYAWRMPHGHMIAYVFKVRDSQPHSAMTAHFKRTRGKPAITNGQRLALQRGPDHVGTAACLHTRDIVETVHLRSAPLLPGRTNPIVLRHLWLCET